MGSITFSSFHAAAVWILLQIVKRFISHKLRKSATQRRFIPFNIEQSPDSSYIRPGNEYRTPGRQPSMEEAVALRLHGVRKTVVASAHSFEPQERICWALGCGVARAKQSRNGRSRKVRQSNRAAAVKSGTECRPAQSLAVLSLDGSRDRVFYSSSGRSWTIVYRGPPGRTRFLADTKPTFSRGLFRT